MYRNGVCHDFSQKLANFNNSEIRPNTNSKQYAHLLYINNIKIETSVNRPAMGPENLDGFEGLVNTGNTSIADTERFWKILVISVLQILEDSGKYWLY
jgi:hypothetical protein